MGDLRRWNVTYTKHVKQKRKVYQDGFLEFDGSINKVMLYDECLKLLDNRPLKKDEVVESGETLAFDAYLVDIGDLEGGLKPIIKLEIEEKEKKTTKMTEIHQGQKPRNNPTFVGKGTSKSCQSPSGNLIRVSNLAILLDGPVNTSGLSKVTMSKSITGLQISDFIV